MTPTRLKNILKKHGVDSKELLSELVEELGLSTKTLEERKKEFTESLAPYLEEYGREMLNEFYFYFSSHKVGDNKMNFEKQRSWHLESRLKNWAQNSKKFSLVSMLKSKK